MNPQPVSLADELRRVVERLRTIGDALRTTNLIRGREIHQLADDFARFAAHAAEQPKLTAEDAHRIAAIKEREETHLKFTESKLSADVLWLISLLTSPVAPPPPRREMYHEAIEHVLNMRRADLANVQSIPSEKEYYLGRAHRCDDILFWLGHIEANLPAGPPPVAPGEQPPNEFPCPEDERKATTAGESGIIPAGNLPAEAQERASAKSTLVDIMVGNTWEQSVAAFERALTTAAKQAREECAGKLEKVAAQCEAGGHTSRGKMFRAIAAEFRT